METVIASLLAMWAQPGSKAGLVVGLIASPILMKLVSPALAWATKYALAGTAKITPLVAKATTTACVWALSFPVVRSIITSNPKACETLVDTLASCASAIILTIQTTVDQQIEAAGLQKAPDAAPAATNTPPTPA